MLPRYSSKPSEKAWTALKRILRYLKGTLDYGIGYTNDSDKMRGFTTHELWGYVDSAFADDEIDQKSTYCDCIFIN